MKQIVKNPYATLHTSSDLSRRRIQWDSSKSRKSFTLFIIQSFGRLTPVFGNLHQPLSHLTCNSYFPSVSQALWLENDITEITLLWRNWSGKPIVCLFLIQSETLKKYSQSDASPVHLVWSGNPLGLCGYYYEQLNWYLQSFVCC